MRLSPEKKKYGMSLAEIMVRGDNGEAKSSSMVPFSFSLTMAILVIIAQMSRTIKPITPGTKLYSERC